MQPYPAAVRRRRRLALAVILALPAVAEGADASADTSKDAPNCPVGVFKCPSRPISWEMCKKSDLLDFYVPGLPTEGERASVPREATAQKVHSPDKTHYVLEGQAQIRQLDLLLRAEKLTYDTETTDYSAEGNVRYQDRGMLLSADRARGNNDLDRCTLDGVRYQLLSSRGNGVAQVAIMEDADHARLKDATYSTCDLGDQQWAFQARQLDLDQAEGVGRGRNVTFRVLNVPIFWFPYVRFPLDNRRVSGFLYPSIGYGSRRGLDVTLPYYLNLAPNYDATIYPRYMTERGFMLGAEFRYLTERSSGTFNFDVMTNDSRAKDEERTYGENLPGSRWWVQWNDNTSLGPNWNIGIGINRVSDARYFEDFGRGLYSSAIGFLSSNAYLNGHGDWWSASLGGDSYQITDPTLPDSVEPYRRLPRLTFNAEKALLGDFTAGVTSEFIDFKKSNYGVPLYDTSGQPVLDPNGNQRRRTVQPLEGNRIDLFPYLAYPIEGAGYFIRPQIGYRYTAYDLSHPGQDPAQSPLVKKSSPSRGVPIFSLDTGLVFERSLDIGGEAWTQTLEPRAYYLRVPYRDQTDLPIFDTQEIPFSFGELFRTNRFVGADRQMDANNLSLALTTRLLENASGVERVSASIGQIHYFDDQRVQMPGPGPTYQPVRTDYSGSAYAGEIDVHLTDRWRVVLDQQWNPNSHRTDLSTFTVQNRFGGDGIVNFSYRFRRDFLEQVDLSAAIPLTPTWRLIGRENYALNDPLAAPTDPHGKGGRTLESFLGVEHDTCCVTWRVLARRWIHDTRGETDSAIYFELEFKGVGSIGQKTDTFLRRGILGYR